MRVDLRFGYDISAFKHTFKMVDIIGGNPEGLPLDFKSFKPSASSYTLDVFLSCNISSGYMIY